MVGEQIDFLDRLFCTGSGELCKSMDEAVKNECGVFTTNSVMFPGFVSNCKDSVTIKIAKRTPFIYFAFDCCNMREGKSNPCMESKGSRFNVTDGKDDVMRMIGDRLTRFCGDIVGMTNIEKALSNMRKFI